MQVRQSATSASGRARRRKRRTATRRRATAGRAGRPRVSGWRRSARQCPTGQGWPRVLSPARSLRASFRPQIANSPNPSIPTVDGSEKPSSPRAGRGAAGRTLGGSRTCPRGSTTLPLSQTIARSPEIWGGSSARSPVSATRIWTRRFSADTRTGPRTSTPSPRSASGRSATRCCGSGSHPGRPRRGGLALDGRAAGPPARARHAADRDTAAPRQRPRLYRPARPDVRAEARRLRPRVAERYPWLDDYTPVNEPLTTARFSGALRPLVSARPRPRDVPARLVNQMRGRAAGHAGDPRGQPRGPAGADRGPGPRLQHPARSPTRRRSRTTGAGSRFDLLPGASTRGHPLRRLPAAGGVAEAELGAGPDAPCPPDIVGINHYLSSERFLDERLERYPAAPPRGNGRDRYADVEAIRVLSAGAGRPGGAAARGLGALPAAGGGHRGAQRLHARRAAPLAARGLGRGAAAAPERRRHPGGDGAGRCSAATSGTAC